MFGKDKGVKIKERNYNLLILTIFFCSILVILSNYVFSKQVAQEVHKLTMENEYNKLGGKENYNLLKEIQKEEILTYLDNLREEKPEYIESIIKKVETEEKSVETEEKSNIELDNVKKMGLEVLEKLKEDTYIKGNSGSLVTILEFSDLECPYCKDFHNSNIIENILNSYSGSIAYGFKHFPLPKHENARKEAEATKCIENLGEEGKSLEYIDNIFKETTSGGTGYDLGNLAELAAEVGVDKEEFMNCYNEERYKDLVTKEFNEGIGLEVDSTPSSVIINNETGDYIIMPGIIGEEELEEVIDSFIK